MAGPITWRNLGGGGNGAAQLLRGGQDQIMGAGDSLLRTLDQFRKINVANAGVIKQNNTQDYLDQVAAVADPSQLASPEVQAQLAQARLGYGDNIDRAATRTAVDQRLNQLQQAASATQKYNDAQEEVAQRPVLEDLAAKLYSGDTAGYNQVLADNSLRDEAGLRKQLQSYTDDATNRGYRAAGEQRAQGAEQRAIGSFNLSQEVGKENLANSRQERQYRSDQRDVALAGEAIKSVTDESAGALAAKQANNIFATGSTDINKDTSTLLSKAGLGEGEYDSWNPFATDVSSRQNIQKGVTSLLADGVKLKRDGKEVDVPIPPAMVEQYLAAAKGKSYFGLDPSKDMRTHFQDLFKDNPELAERAFEGLDAKKEHNNLVSALKKEERKIRLSKNPKLSSTLDSIQTLRDKITGNAVPLPAALPGPEEDSLPIQWPPKEGASFY